MRIRKPKKAEHDGCEDAFDVDNDDDDDDDDYDDDDDTDES